MKKIEQGMNEIHGCASPVAQAEPTMPATSHVKEEEPGTSLYTEPFLRVNLVSPGSPAESAVQKSLFVSIYGISLAPSLSFTKSNEFPQGENIIN